MAMPIWDTGFYDEFVKPHADMTLIGTWLQNGFDAYLHADAVALVKENRNEPNGPVHMFHAEWANMGDVTRLVWVYKGTNTDYLHRINVRFDEQPLGMLVGFTEKNSGNF